MNKPIWDLVIIGGGINGTAIARDAAMRGLKVILLEKADFGSGASTNTSKMAHGGIRYLEHLKFNLVKTSLYEREVLIHNAPHLVKLVPFIFPRYEGDSPSLLKTKIGLYIYDLLSSQSSPHHKNLSSAEITRIYPELQDKDLVGGCLFYDGVMQDQRIVIENMLSAKEAGAHMLNYVKAIAINKSDNGLFEVEYLERNDLHNKLTAKCVVNATGAWSNEFLEMDPTTSLRVGPTRGIHLVLPLINPQHALILSAPQDDRIFFLVPWGNVSILGTTDISFEGNPDQLIVTPEEVDYLLEAINHYFANQPIDRSQIIYSYAGLRPLVKTSTKEESSISREHVIEMSKQGIITILGGKYTTHREVAEEVVDKLIKEYFSKKALEKCKTQSTPLYGGSPHPWFSYDDEKLETEARTYHLSLEQLKGLMKRYGSAFIQLLELLKEYPDEVFRICDNHPHLIIELRYAIDREKAKKLSDWFLRRTDIGLSCCQSSNCLMVTANKFAELLNWDDAKIKQEIEEYKAQQTSFSLKLS